VNRHDALDRELRTWLVDAPVPRTPGFRDDVLQQTAQLRQRPRWSFPERWLPVTVVRFRRRRAFPPVPWRTIGVLAALALLLAVVAVYVGSRQQRLPPPFGLARSGHVAYAQNGDIFTVDPATGVRREITSVPEIDQEPRWSPDGTRLAFLRGTQLATALIVVDGVTGEMIARSPSQPNVDTDTMAWSPDGRMITIDSVDGELNLVDAATGSMTRLDLPYAFLDVYWRPPDGRQLLFLGGSNPDAPDVALYVVDLDDPGSLQEIAGLPPGAGVLRPNGWADGGRKVVYTAGNFDIEPLRTHVMDLATGNEVIIDAAFAHVSNDGKRIVALDDLGRPCVASVDGGPCRAIGTRDQAFNGGHAAGVTWSPDDAWIVTRGPDSREAFLLDPDGQITDQPSWIDDGAISWQRVAP
jgi:Tol biopolymer transport system component